MTIINKNILENVKQNQFIATAMVLNGDNIGKKLIIYPDRSYESDLDNTALEKKIVQLSIESINLQQSKRLQFTMEEKVFDLFIDILSPMPKMIIIGAVHIAIPLVTLGKIAGFHTIVVDPRKAFAMEEKFSHADQLVVAWPTDVLDEIGIDEATCFITLTHDEKIDNPSLAYALQSPARYIGALGSVKTHAQRKDALIEMGFTEDDLNKIHAPIGLNIGAKGPNEIAISVISEIIAQSHGLKLR